MLGAEHTNAKGIQELYQAIYSENLLKAKKAIIFEIQELTKGKYWFSDEHKVKRRKKHEKHDKCIVPNTPPVVKFIIRAENIHEKYCTRAIREANKVGEIDVKELLIEKAGRVNSLCEKHTLIVAIHDIYQTHYMDILTLYIEKVILSDINDLLAMFSVYEYDTDTQSQEEKFKLINKIVSNELEVIQKKHYNQALREVTRIMDSHRPEDKDFSETYTQIKPYVRCYNETKKQTKPLAKFKCKMCGEKSNISPDEDNEYFCPKCGIQLGV